MKISYGIFQIILRPEEEIQLPPYKGSTFRGGFGVAFRRVVCALKKTDCSECMLKTSCIYAYVFETEPDEQIHVFGRVRSIPRPFVLEPPLEQKTLYQPGENLIFNLVLIGKAIEFLPYFIYTFDSLGNIGIGKGRGKFTLERVVQLPHGELLYTKETATLKKPYLEIINLDESNNVETNELRQENLKLSFLTPTRIKYQRRYTIKLEFHILMRQVLRRLFLLWYFHCDGKTQQALPQHHKQILPLATQVHIQKNNLTWFDWERYSHRQKQKIKLGGFVGEITYRGVLKPFLPYLKAAEVLHIGKGTTFGLGKFRIEV